MASKGLITLPKAKVYSSSDFIVGSFSIVHSCIAGWSYVYDSSTGVTHASFLMLILNMEGDC